MSNSTTSSTPLSADDIYYMDLFGLALVQYSISVVCESIFWTMYLVLFCFAMRIQMRRGLRTLPTIGMFVVTCVLFLSSTSLWISNVTTFFGRMNRFFRAHPEFDIVDRLVASNAFVMPFGLPEEALFLINMIVGDAVVIWRAWVLYQDSRLRRLVYLPMIVLTTSFALTVIALQCLAQDSWGQQSSIPSGSRTCRWSEPLAWALSLLTNIMSTTLIAVKAWQHRQYLRSGLGRAHPRSTSERVLIVLVESGFAYCLFWASQVILFIDMDLHSNATYLLMVLSSMGDQISGIYPTAIIVLVNIQRSITLEGSKMRSIHIDSGKAGPHTTEVSTIRFNVRSKPESLSSTTPAISSTVTDEQAYNTASSGQEEV